MSRTIKLISGVIFVAPPPEALQGKTPVDQFGGPTEIIDRF